MSVLARGMRNAFRNTTRSVAIVLILGLALGLSFVMLVAHRTVSAKVASTLSSVGNTVNIGPPGFSAGGQLGTFLTAAELAPIAQLPGVTGVDEYFNGAVKAHGLPPNAAQGSGTPVGNAGPGHCPTGATCKSLGRRGKGQAGRVKQGSTSLNFPGSVAFATQGLACEPKPCTPPVSFYTIYFSGSTQPTNPANIGASSLRVVSGQAISGTATADAAMISTAMAAKNHLKVGSTFAAYGTTFTVAAIFASDTQQGDDTVITPLPVLEHLERAPGVIFSAVVTAASAAQLATVTTEIGKKLGPKASVVSYTADAQKAVTALDGVKSIAVYSLSGAVGAAIVILLLVMVLIVRERKREIGILKAIGASNGRIMAQFTAEAVTFTLLGAVVGLLAGIVAASSVTSSLVSHSGVAADTGARGLFGAGSPFLTHLSDINTQTGWGVILEALAAALVVAVLASATAAWLIGRIRPAEVLRSA